MLFKRTASERLKVVELRGLIYAVGDIHGRLDLLLQALRRIKDHAAGRPSQIVTLGDYVDRGPDSRGVVEHLIEAQQAGGVICLKGNHEQMMVEAVRERGAALSRWLDNGGLPALSSYGAAHPGDVDLVPQKHIDWMASLPVLARDGRRVYVHAGVAPGRPLERQREHTCLWIREAFLQAAAGDLPGHVVHGHTPVWANKQEPSAPELLPHRTNLDTGAFFTDVLAVGVFDSEAPGGPLEILT